MVPALPELNARSPLEADGALFRKWLAVGFRLRTVESADIKTRLQAIPPEALAFHWLCGKFRA